MAAATACHTQLTPLTRQVFLQQKTRWMNGEEKQTEAVAQEQTQGMREEGTIDRVKHKQEWKKRRRYRCVCVFRGVNWVWHAVAAAVPWVQGEK